ncbi:MAG: tRNA(Ile)-lysidine synthetase [uncultured Acidimicrobiales bacterium]|uniref:tRNA(Ile)-lysidine synthase n=1 Tax=uncultured Acidimicrobiales bacterium TaxID=310071 RepID=A0A6J4IBM8_9ACTN|nr:MAG: tRNA(Ile)-lysidine synthetase [uncultured Acidimicrobiales bacterium]
MASLRSELLARSAFPPGSTPIICAVSGGADSLALLVLACAAGGSDRVTAVHVDHGLRDGSEAEAVAVAIAAARYGARFEARRVELRAGPNLEARAREARRSVLPPDAMTGHTAEDSAETMLLNLVRGAGLDGLAGIRPGPTKPLLALRRSETRALCAAEGLDWLEDPSNADPSFRRNRVRHELLPLLDDIAARDVVAVLVRQAELLRADADHLAADALVLDPTDALALAAAPVALARRAIRRWLASDHPPDAATVERVLAVARGEGRACDIGGRRQVRRTAQRLRLVDLAFPPPSIGLGGR